jgi:hypothetical protein
MSPGQHAAGTSSDSNEQHESGVAATEPTDDRVWANSHMALHPNEYFRCNECLLGDSAFQASNIMVPAFKKPPKAELHPDKNYFNTQMANARIKSEHSIGLLKMRFQYLREVRAELGKRGSTCVIGFGM